MATPFLTTKLYIPSVRPELVPRPRLIERLNAGLDRKLTLISAPAGFGKTTLASEWVAGSDRLRPKVRFAWLSLDEGDNDPVRFLTYLIAAIQTIGPDIGRSALSALQSPQPPPTDPILTGLINEITAIPDRIVLVLDDYHLIEAQPIHDALTFLLGHLPPQMHLGLATREDPNLPLASLRAKDQLIEVRAADLRFTSSEASEFLNQVMGLELSAKDIAALGTRTEGWIAGLQLAAISMQGHQDASGFIQSFTGSHRFVLDYLVAEVLEKQSESIQSFLLQTAVLERLSGSLCDAVRFGEAKSPTGQDNSQQILEYLEQANLFIVPLDSERRWYRYHHLFADLLRQRHQQIQSVGVPVLHRRASGWYELNGFPEKAIEHSLRAEDFERAAYLIEVQADAVWESGEHTKMWRWLERLPAELTFSRPELCIYHAIMMFRRGTQDAAERSLQVAENVLNSGIDATNVSSIKRLNQTPDAARTSLLGRVAAMRALTASYRGDAAGIIPYAHRALDYLSKDDLAWRSTAAVTLSDAHSYLGDMEAAYQAQLEALDICIATGNLFLILYANLNLAITLRQSGRLKRAQEICQQQMQVANENGMGHTAVAGWISAILGEAQAELNDLDGAIEQAKRGLDLTEHAGDVMMLGWTYLCLMRVLFSRGDMSAAEEVIQRMKSLGRESELPNWVRFQLAAWQARVWLAQGRLDEVSHWARERGLDTKGDLAYPHEMEYLVLARILISQGAPEEAITLLERLLGAAEAGGRISRVIEILMLRAAAFQAEGDTAQASTTLERALTLAEPGGFIRVFVDEGPPMARLLYEALNRGIAPDYVRRLLAAFPMAEPEKAEPSRAQTAKPELVEPLSERELEVLQLIAEGLTNPEIAARLFLALNTVKTHSRNIYGKLGVHSRTQAVSRARALGLLPSP
jgi:LuxR family maltose regulon positive regulatory protein